MHSTIFATEAEALFHLVRVSAFLSLEPNGIYDFQFHFNDRDPSPARCNTPGKDLTFFIDGAGGERISALDIIWCNQTGAVGTEVCPSHCHIKVLITQTNIRVVYH